MCGIKIPQQDFALKMQRGLFAGHYGNSVHGCCSAYNKPSQTQPTKDRQDKTSQTNQAKTSQTQPTPVLMITFSIMHEEGRVRVGWFGLACKTNYTHHVMLIDCVSAPWSPMYQYL